MEALCFRGNHGGFLPENVAPFSRKFDHPRLAAILYREGNPSWLTEREMWIASVPLHTYPNVAGV